MFKIFANAFKMLAKAFRILWKAFQQAKKYWKNQSWALPVFFNFFNNKKWFFAFFIKLIWLEEGFLNRTDAEISY